MQTIKIKKGTERIIGVKILLFALVVVVATGITGSAILTAIGIVVGTMSGVLGIYFLSGVPFLRTCT